MPETTRSKWNKEKPPSVWATKDTDGHLMVLDSVNFYLKQSTPLLVDREMDYNYKKAVLQENLYCQENSMLK